MNTLNSLNIERINQRNEDRLKDFEARGSSTIGPGAGGGGVTGYRFSDPKDELAQLDSMLMDMISKDPGSGGGGGSAGDFYGGAKSPILDGMRESKPQFDPPMASIHEEFNEQTVKFDDNGFRFS